MDKSPDAFRTISEVAEVLETPAHVLRFWESRFPQIRPVKRAGGRRYYRPADVALLTGIKHLLHDEGMTIRGVQKILREQGVRHVAGLSGQEVPDEAEAAEAALEAALTANFGAVVEPDMSQEQAETAQIVALETALSARAPEPASADILPLFDHAASKANPPEVAVAVDDAKPQSDAAESAKAEEPQEAAPVAAAQPDRPEPDLPELSLLERLRALPPGAFAHVPQARALRDRLAVLAARLAAPPQPSQH
jgi:DNA-binding transcriptional MerR regulator